MCGIIGFNWEDKSLLRRMAEVIIHRGPDDAAYFTDSGVSLGMRRLSIIDLKKGLYPITNENEDLFLIFNGEIYNFEEIRAELENQGHKFKTDTDAEVIVHAYEEHGINCLNLFNGMFSICIYDSRKKELILARDRLGIKPVYYYENKGNFVFASEIKSILELNSVKREMNREAINHYFCLGYNPLEETVFKDIKKLLPGNYLIFDLEEKTFNTSQYWNLNFKTENKSLSFYQKKIFELLKDSVKKRLISDVPLGVFLSGGLDSSTIVFLMDQIRKEQGSNTPIKTYSVGFKHGEKVNETMHAKKISEKFGTEHKEFLIEPDVVKLLPQIAWHCDEPTSDPALIPVLLLSEAAKKTSTVILTGDGGDELFGGYDHHWILNAVNNARKIPFSKQIGPMINHCIPLKAYDKFYKYASDVGKEGYKIGDQMIKEIKDNPAKAYYTAKQVFNEETREELMKEEHFQKTNFNRINNVFFKQKNNFLKQLLYFDKKRLLAEGYLMKTDRMTMARSIEARVPFLDHRLVELTSKMPDSMKIKGLNHTKFILKRMMSKHLGKDHVYRKKQGFFMPIDNWLNKELKGTVDDLLNITKIYREGILSPEYVKKIKENYDKGKIYYSRQLWALMSFELWYRQFILKEKVK